MHTTAKLIRIVIITVIVVVAGMLVLWKITENKPLLPDRAPVNVEENAVINDKAEQKMDTPPGDTSTGSTSTGNTSYTPNNNTHDVSVTYQEGESSATIYSVDIVWESMEFTYTAASEGTWDPSTHTFIDVERASWSFANNKITVTNHSNTEVKAEFTYAPAANFDTVSGAFVDSSGTALTNATLTLNSAVGSTLDEAPSGTAYLSLTGELSSSLETQTICGTVTVTIN